MVFSTTLASEFLNTAASPSSHSPCVALSVGETRHQTTSADEGRPVPPLTPPPRDAPPRGPSAAVGRMHQSGTIDARLLSYDHNYSVTITTTAFTNTSSTIITTYTNTNTNTNTNTTTTTATTTTTNITTTTCTALVTFFTESINIWIHSQIINCILRGSTIHTCLAFVFQ